MSNFKSGSGNLDFGGDEEAEADETDETEPEGESAPTPTQTDADEEVGNGTSETEPQSTTTTGTEYPYFVRRSNVGDERDTRLEIHVRDKVAEGEAEFRTELAEQLGTNEVSKTDAREFALLAAFTNPEQVAELMEEEGFGTLG